MMEASPYPFAPLPPAGASPAGHATPNKGAETWRPILPAPLPLPAALRHPKHGTPSRVWQYRDGCDALLFVVARFDLADGDKEFAPYACGPAGWRWKGVPSPRPLYGLPGLAQRPDAPVVVVEGEKAADAASALLPGFVVVSWPHGAEQPHLADWSPLAGRRCILWPDNDVTGFAAMAKVAEALDEAGAASIAAIQMPEGWPGKWDLADPLPDGVTLPDLAAMLDAAEPLPSAATEDADDTDHAAPGAPSAETLDTWAKRAADMDRMEYAAARKAMASEMPGVRLSDLDKLRDAERKRRAAAAREAFDAMDDEEATSAAGEASPRPGPRLRWPPGFAMRKAGLFVEREEGGERIAGPFTVLGRMRDEGSNGWGLALEWSDDDGAPHRELVPSRLIHAEPGALESRLSEAGLFVSPDPGDRLALRDALAGLKTTGRVRRAARCGWHAFGPDAAPVYLLADGATFGAVAEPVLLDNSTAEAAARCAPGGDLAAWQAEVAALAVGNASAAFCIAGAFVGPILEVAGEPSGGFHIAGPSKIGKTTAMQMGVSVWGLPYKRGALRDWRSTANAMEAALEEACDGLLALDEIGQAEPREVEAAVYQAANEGGKARLRADATARARRTWRAFLLSTGEVSPAQKAAEGGRSLRPGADVRLPALCFALDAADMWPALHHHPNRAALWRAVHGAMVRHYGAAGRAFLAKLVAARRKDEAGLRDAIAVHRHAFLAANLPADAAEQTRTVANRCALVAAAGEMAADMGILPWPQGEASTAAAVALACWQSERDDSQSGEDAAALRAVRGFVERHGEARFGLIERDKDGKLYVADAARVIVNRVGWRIRPAQDGQPWRYLILPETWRGEVCAGLDPQAAARTLRRAGFLSGGDGNNLARKEWVPSEGRQVRVYAVSGTILE